MPHSDKSSETREAQASDTIPVLELRDLRLTFAGEGESPDIALFRGLDLSIAPGELFAVIGPSGEGKTTLLKVMAGLIAPDGGEVRYRGRDLRGLSHDERLAFRRKVGMTFQRSGLFDSLSCGENLHFPLRELGGKDTGRREARVGQALREVGLEGQERLKIHEMSGGMQKRLGIARALLLSPEVVLYDDPTAGLDPITARSILELIVDMKRKYAMTVVMVTSDPGPIYAIADRVGFLYQGDFLQVGTPSEIHETASPAVAQFTQGLLQGPLTSGGREFDRV